MDNNNQNVNGNIQNTTGYMPEEKKTNVLAIISLVLGILSIITSCCYVYAGLVLGIAGLVCAILSKKQGKSGLGTAGLVCSIIGLVFSVILIILVVFVYASVGGTQGLMEMLQQYSY